jgi:metallophosphoesterase (TIGR00282 family)
MVLGDIVGRSGRDAVVADVPRLRRTLALDFVIANGENAAGGFGLTLALAESLFAAGIDCLTNGNHCWDQREFVGQIDRDPRLLRPRNYPPGTPGRGAAEYRTGSGRRIVVVNVMGRLFMDPLDDPFQSVEQELAKHRLGSTAEAIVVDIHGEASSEKQAMAHLLDGRVSMVIGTHTHVPTADAQVLPGGTAYQTDIGMCGDYDSIIGMKKSIPIQRFTRKLPTERLEPADGPATLCGVVVEIDDRTGLALRIDPLRLGGRLQPAEPSKG